MIDCYIYTRKIAEIKVPHSIYDLFVYEECEEYTNTNIHYGMYELTKLKEEIDNMDYDLTDEEKEFMEENYKFCENLFENENVDEVRFLDEDF